ncbi:MAG: hypothetical protein M5U26_28220 [Planctomycetota bacterium]|nr:hypothetical protein [Planctomycetota bacterium]
MYDPDVLKIKRGGGWLMLFGFPFFAMGSMFCIAGIMGQVQSSGGGPAPVLFVVPFSLIFVSIGAAFMFGRYGLILNRRERTAATWWGLLIPFKTTVHQLGDDALVTISRETRRNKNSTYTVFPVRIAFSGTKVDVEEPQNFERARTEAERVAKFMDLGLADRSGGVEILREKGTLDESLRERLRREGTALQPPQRPENCRVEERVEGDEAVFDLPKPEVPPVAFLAAGCGLIVAFGIMGVVGFSFFAGAANTPAVWIILPFGVLMGVGVLSTIVKAAKDGAAPERIVVSTRGLRLVKGRKTTEIPADRLEELYVDELGRVQLGGRRGLIVARSDEQNLSFGAGMTSAERAWLCDVIRFLVTAPEK